ncbi:unnamed protein product [Polarella glacialis]|uniref:Uncharacterized protein n=1 Tax=Polarella glacialis TaxID=89957 RepID=A0A813HAL1_POLGL|nr:unnamed protein product [Polarella glacialis]
MSMRHRGTKLWHNFNGVTTGANPTLEGDARTCDMLAGTRVLAHKRAPAGKSRWQQEACRNGALLRARRQGISRLSAWPGLLRISFGRQHEVNCMPPERGIGWEKASIRTYSNELILWTSAKPAVTCELNDELLLLLGMSQGQGARFCCWQLPLRQLKPQRPEEALASRRRPRQSSV